MRVLPAIIHVEFQSCIDLLHERFRNPLPGPEVQLRMAPVSRRRHPGSPSAAKSKSGVLLLLYPGDGQTRFLLIERADGGVHSGQYGLPGGKYEPGDESLQQTALREAEEETGIAASKVRMIGALSDLYIPVSGYHVFPYVGWLPEPQAFIPDPAEVRQIIEADLAPFLEGGLLEEAEFETSYGRQSAPCFNYEGARIWGATSMILNEFFHLLK